ncbi:MAG: hypothetical protein HKO03_04170 [Acidimicrobiia bacterium]|nr:hypothetical protein [Acidimicrobiia bacterium]
MRRSLVFLVAVAGFGLAGCTALGLESPDGEQSSEPTTSTSTSTTTTSSSSTTTTTTTTIPAFDLTGVVTAPSGLPLADAVVSIAGTSAVTGSDGAFTLESIPAGTVTVERPAWMAKEFEFAGEPTMDVQLEPRTVRALRVSSYTSMEPEKFAALLDLAEGTTVNALAFDTKDETGYVLYDTTSQVAAEIGSINPQYDPREQIAVAKDRGLYTITRIVTFEDRVWSAAKPEDKLSWIWMDPLNQSNWTYPLELAVEACELGFDEIQFDYVRFPAGKTAAAAERKRPTTADDRVGAITGFLSAAVDKLHPLGCAVSADIFAIVMSSPGDEGIGQRIEELSRTIDAISPMIYPSHYSDGWLGFANPNSHPGPVVAFALDKAIPRLEGTAILRPYLQAFYYNGSQIGAQITEAEARGLGWLLWNAGGDYAESWLPAS